jgi:hypothetical protein
MQERGWNQEFRTMGYKVLIQKKISRNLGADTDNRGQQHMRRNLLQIIQVEGLLGNKGWGCKRMSKELPNLAASIPDFHPLKLYFCNQLSEVMKSKNYVQKLCELYDLVVEASTFELSSESQFDGED